MVIASNEDEKIDEVMMTLVVIATQSSPRLQTTSPNKCTERHYNSDENEDT